jgi:hypothetical protein
VCVGDQPRSKAKPRLLASSLTIPSSAAAFGAWTPTRLAIIATWRRKFASASSPSLRDLFRYNPDTLHGSFMQRACPRCPNGQIHRWPMGETGNRCVSRFSAQSLCCPRNGKEARVHSNATGSIYPTREGGGLNLPSPETGHGHQRAEASRGSDGQRGVYLPYATSHYLPTALPIS